MAKKFAPKKMEDDKVDFWMTTADCFFGMMMVFMTLFALALTGFNQDKLQQKADQSEVAKELSQNLAKEKIDAQVDTITGQVKISDWNLFDVGSAELSQKGKQYLNKFIPVYLETILSNKKLADKIENISIQGHTDSQTFKNLSSPEQQFTKNMELSTRRANAVEEYLFKTPYDKKYSPKLMKMIVVEGKSFTEPILVNGKEDYAKSRRVELKINVKDTNGVQDLLMNKKK